MGIEGTDEAALASLRALSAEQVLRGAPAPPGAERAAHRDDADPRRQAGHGDGRDRLQGPPPAACAAPGRQQQRRHRRQPGEGDHQGAAVRPVRPVERPGEGGLRSRRNDRSGRAGLEGERRLRPGRAGPLRRERLRGQRFARLSLPVLLRARPRCGNRCGRGPRTAAKSASCSARWRPRPGATPSPEDLAVSRMAQSYWVNFAKTGDPNGPGLPDLAASRPRQGPDLRVPARWLGGRGPRSPEGAARRDAVGHRIGEAVRPVTAARLPLDRRQSGVRCRSSVLRTRRPPRGPQAPVMPQPRPRGGESWGRWRSRASASASRT